MKKVRELCHVCIKVRQERALTQKDHEAIHVIEGFIEVVYWTPFLS